MLRAPSIRTRLSVNISRRLHHIGKLCVDILSHLESHIARIGLCSTVHGSLQAVGVYHREDAHGGDEHRQEYLVTTKRGTEGSAKIDVGFNATLKSPSKLPNKYDSYDALMFRNTAIEHELALRPDSWEYIRPQKIEDEYIPMNQVAKPTHVQ